MVEDYICYIATFQAVLLSILKLIYKVTVCNLLRMALTSYQTVEVKERTHFLYQGLVPKTNGLGGPFFKIGMVGQYFLDRDNELVIYFQYKPSFEQNVKIL